jgi:transposase
VWAGLGIAASAIPEALASSAGVAPPTRQWGKVEMVGFRWAVDRQLRDALVEWAGDSRLSSR